MKVVFNRMLDSLGVIPVTLIFLLIMVAATALTLWIFFKLPTREGGVYGGLESIKDPEEREAMRRYVFGLDEERPVIGKEKQKAEAKGARAAERDEKSAAAGAATAAILDAEFETVSDEEPEETIVEEIAEEVGEIVEEVMEELVGDADDGEETL